MALDVPVGWNTCALTTPGVRCPVEEATWPESTENSVHCACWHESNYGDVPCCWCGQAGRFEGFVQSCCVDCDTPITYRQDAPRPLLCPSCEETAAEAQRDHQVREAAHELLAALVGMMPPGMPCFCPQPNHRGVHWEHCHRAMDAIAKARGSPHAN